MNEQILMTIIGGMLGAFSVFGIIMFVSSLKKPKRKTAYELSEIDFMALKLGRELLTDVYETAEEKRWLYFQNGYREYDAYEIPLAIEAIDKLLIAHGQEGSANEVEDPFELN